MACCKGETIGALAAAIRIAIGDAERDALCEAVAAAWDAIDARLPQNDAGIRETFGMIEGRNAFREDIPHERTGRSDMLSNAPDRDGRAFLVPFDRKATP